MILLETMKQYHVFTQNDRAIGTVFYRKNGESEDIIFKPFFYLEGDPSIGVLYENIEAAEWKTSRELFGRYLDDPYFQIGFPTISFIIDLEIKVPEWMGGRVLVLVLFDNEGKAVCRYGAEKIGTFLVTEFDYEGEIDLEETSRFTYKKIKEEAPTIEIMINTIPRSMFNEVNLDEDDNNNGDDC